MGVYDQAARFAAKADPCVVPMRLLAGSGLALTFREWLDTRTLPLPGGTERTADVIAALDDPAAPDAPWLLVLEFQSQHDPDKLDVTLEEVAILRSRARSGDEKRKYKVAVGLIYLRDRCPVDTLDMRFPDGSGTRHAPRVWNIAQDSAVATIDAVAVGSLSWGMLFWVPLMGGADTDEPVRRWKDAVTARVGNRSDLNNLAGIALVFAELAGRGIVWKRGLEGSGMTESAIVNEWMSQGEARGVLRNERQLLLRALNKRFPGAVPAEVTKLVNEQDSLDLLNHWFDTAVSATTFDEFLAVLKR